MVVAWREWVCRHNWQEDFDSAVQHKRNWWFGEGRFVLQPSSDCGCKRKQSLGFSEHDVATRASVLLHHCF